MQNAGTNASTFYLFTAFCKQVKKKNLKLDSSPSLITNHPRWNYWKTDECFFQEIALKQAAVPSATVMYRHNGGQMSD